MPVNMACNLATIPNQQAGQSPPLANRPNYKALVNQPLHICGGILLEIMKELGVDGIEVGEVLAMPVTPQQYYVSPLCAHTGDPIPYKQLTHGLRVLHADQHFSSTNGKAATYVWQTGNKVEIFFLYKDGKDTKVGSLSIPLNELNCGQMTCKCRDNCKKS